MNRLIKIELTKLFKKRGIRLIFVLLIITSFLTVYFGNKKEIVDNTNYQKIDIMNKSEYLNESKYNYYKNYKYQVSQYNNIVDDNIKIYNYAKENDINLHIKEKRILEYSYTIFTFLSIIIAVIGCALLSNELSKKSIKELITKPFKRWKFVTAKYISLLILTILYFITIIISMSIFTSVLTNINVINLKELVIDKNKIIEMSYYIKFLKDSLIYLMPLLFIGSFSLFLSTFILNSSISSGIIIFLTLTSTLLFQLLFQIDLKFIQYSFLPYLDITLYKNIWDTLSINTAFGVNLNMQSGIIILIAYYFLFFILSNLIFSKKDIKN